MMLVEIVDDVEAAVGAEIAEKYIDTKAAVAAYLLAFLEAEPFEIFAMSS